MCRELFGSCVEFSLRARNVADVIYDRRLDGGMTHGLEKNGADVSEQSAFGALDASLGDESEELGHYATNVFAGAKFRASAEELIGNGASFGVVGLFVKTFMDDAKSGGAAAERIEAASTMSGSEAAAIF